MHSHDITAAVAAERTNARLAAAATDRLVRGARRSQQRPAATRVTVRLGLFRRWGEATA